MKTTIDLPEDLFHRAKVVAAQRQITLKELIITGLNSAIQPGKAPAAREAALARLHKGYRLGGKPLSRNQTHERHTIS
jgi:hypothetical protein